MQQKLKNKQHLLHLTGLSGLRAFAAIGVVIHHIGIELESFGLPLLAGRDTNGYPSGLQWGRYGVPIFFSLSGFLITYLLLLEKNKQRINIKSFYMRRILRIWPLYYFYLLLVFFTYWIQGIDHPSTLPYYLFFSANIPFLLQLPLPLLSHYWSLGVEEQFYLFWPWIVRRFNSKLFHIVAGLITLTVVCKLFLHFVLHKSFSQTIIDAFPFHCMMLGGAGAILYKNRNSFFLNFATHKLAQAVAWLGMTLMVLNRFHVASILDPEIISFLTVLIIVAQITQKNRLINLEQKGFDFLGKISFGIYIYHPLVIFLTSKLLGPLAMPALPKYLLVYLTVSGLTILIAHLSYNYFESYFLRLKERFAVVKSAATKEAKELRMPRKTEPFQQSTESN